jgi:NADH-quinone oxidoreductase subunit C
MDNKKLDVNEIFDIIKKDFSDSIEFIDGNNFIVVSHKKWYELAHFLKEDDRLFFDYLMCISSYDKEDMKTYGLAYNFKSTKNQSYLEIRIEVCDEDSVPSVTDLWGSANWHEREAFDMMGIKFKNHPNFKRILLPDDWPGYPLRKDFETPEYYRGMLAPKDKTYWE